MTAEATKNPAASRSRLSLAIAFFVFTRIVVVTVAFLAPLHREGKPWWPENPLIRWDAGHYWGILVQGYPPTINDTTAFFPLYPLTVWPLWKSIVAMDRMATGHDYAGEPGLPRNAIASEWSMVIVSHAAALLALIVFYRWCAKLAGHDAALRACVLLSAFPTAMYFSTGYAESVFVLCIALALWWVSTRRPLLACLACAAATATRPTGIILSAVVLLMLLLQASEQGWLKRIVRLVPLGILSISGLLLHTFYLKQHYGRADAYFAAQAGWPHAEPVESPLLQLLTLQPVLEPAIKPFKYAFRGQFRLLADGRTWNILINLVMVVLAIAGLRRPGVVPRAAFLLTLLTFLLAYQDDPFSGGRLLGIARYHLISLPVFLWLATTRRLERSPLVVVLLAEAMLLLQCCYMMGYVDWILVS